MAATHALLLGLALAVPATFAHGAAPDVLLQTVADEVIDKMRQTPPLPAAEPDSVAALVETRILPLFDFTRMTQLALARSWHVATPDQKKAITEEFKGLVVRAYSTALSRYAGERVVFKPLRSLPAGNEVTVRSEVKQPGQQRTTMDYDMEKTPQGWRIYNVKVADVCLVSTYRDVFAEKVRHGGVDGLIKFMADENRAGGSRFNSIQASSWEKSRLMYAILQNALRSGPQ